MTISDKANQILTIINEKNISKIEKLNIISSLQSPTDNQLSDPQFKSMWIMYHNISTPEKIHLLKSMNDDYLKSIEEEKNEKKALKIIKKIDGFSLNNLFLRYEIKNRYNDFYLEIKDIKKHSNVNFSLRVESEKLSLTDIAIIRNNEKLFDFLIQSNLLELNKEEINSSFYYSIISNNKKAQDVLSDKYGEVLKSSLKYNFNEAYIISLQKGNTERYNINKFGTEKINDQLLTDEFKKEILENHKDIINPLKNLTEMSIYQNDLFKEKIEKLFIYESFNLVNNFSEKEINELSENIKEFYKISNKEIPEFIGNKINQRISFICNKNTLKEKMLSLKNNNQNFIPKLS